jgi:TRAP-type transport system periplasmic protein
MKQKVVYLAIAVVLIASLVLAGCSATTTTTTAPATSSTTTAASTTTTTSSAAPTTTAAANAIKLKYADQNSPTGWEGSNAAQPWLNQVTAATNGQVTFEPYWSQSLFKGADSWVSTKNGVADMAWMWHGYWANQTPLADVMSLPMLPFANAKQASGIFWQLYEKYPTLREQFKDNHVLLTWASQPYFLITSKKQVKTLDDIKGMQIRVPGGPPVEMIKALGATPVTKGMPDTYLALQKGEMDGMAVCWEALLSFRQYEVSKYYTYVPLFTVYFTQAMNNNKWNSLSPEVQAQINSVSGLKGSLFWGENMFDTAMTEGVKLVKEQGLSMETYTLPADELAKWSTVAQPIWESWVKKQTDAGHPEAREILNTTLDLIKNYQP